MDQGLATVLAAGLAAGVAVVGYVATQISVRNQQRAQRFAAAVEAMYRYAESPYRIFRRPASDPAVRQQIASEHSAAANTVRYHMHLLRVEAPLAADAYYDLFARVRRLGPVFRAWAWHHPPITDDADMRVVPTFYYDFDPEMDLLVRCMRAEQTWYRWPGRRSRLGRELLAVRQQRSKEPRPPNFEDLDRLHDQTVKDALANWQGRPPPP